MSNLNLPIHVLKSSAARTARCGVGEWRKAKIRGKICRRNIPEICIGLLGGKGVGQRL